MSSHDDERLAERLGSLPPVPERLLNAARALAGGGAGADVEAHAASTAVPAPSRGRRPRSAGEVGSQGSLGLPLGAALDELAVARAGRRAAALMVVISAALLESATRASKEGWAEAPGALSQARALRRRSESLLDESSGEDDQAFAPAEVAADVAALAELVRERGDPAARAAGAAAASLVKAAAAAFAESPD